MTDRVPAPSYHVAHVPRAKADRRLLFTALLDRIAAQEAIRDPSTGLTDAEAASERAYRVRSRYAYHRRVESAHNPLIKP